MNFTLRRDGFIGELYPAEGKKQVLLVVGGGDGMFSIAKKVAKTFSNAGIPACAVAYWKKRGIPSVLEHIPLEYLGTASDRLRELGYRSIGLWGISMGAEYVLLAASYMPEKFDCVVAASPIAFVTQGVKNYRLMTAGSAFSWNGEDLPCQPFRIHTDRRTFFRECRERREYTVRFMYRNIMDGITKDKLIPVWRIKAPVLLFSGGMDAMWPSKESCKRMMQEMKAEHIHYPHGSHFMLPVSLPIDFVYRAERKYRRESREMKQEILKKTLQFFREEWVEPSRS